MSRAVRRGERAFRFERNIFANSLGGSEEPVGPSARATTRRVSRPGLAFSTTPARRETRGTTRNPAVEPASAEGASIVSPRARRLVDRVVGLSAEALLDRLGRTRDLRTTGLLGGLPLDATSVADELTAPLLPPDASMSRSSAPTASAPVSRRATPAKPPAAPTPAHRGWTSGPNAIIYTRTAQDAKLYSLARRWLLVDASGNASFLEATKAEMQRELGVPFRDLMILDPNLPTAYPSSVFIRPRAIVVNLEHIKMIIVSTYALLLGTDAPEPHARQFVAMLQRQLAPRAARPPTAVDARQPPPPTAAASAARARPPSPVPAPPRRVASSSAGFPLDLEADAAAAAAMEDAIDGVHEATTGLLGLRQTPSDLRVLALPFELRVLEAALHDVCKRLLDETMALEFDAAPALEKLADQVNSAALERVRRVKGRMNSLTQRVAAVREELGKLLADDSDMRAMCLTMREEEAAAAEERHHSSGAGGAHHRGAPRAARRSRGGDDESSRAAAPPATGADVVFEEAAETMAKTIVPPPTIATIATSSPSPSPSPSPFPASAPFLTPTPSSPPAAPPAAGEILASFPSPSATPSPAPPPASPPARHRRARRRRRARRSRRSDDDVSSDDAPSSSSSSLSSPSSSSSRASRASEDEHEGVEALLEAYYMHVDFSHKRLTELRDAIEDTEDLAEINLDSQRNQLIKIDLILSNGMLSVGIFSTVAGTFGMNLRTGWESQPDAFREVCFVSAAVCFAVFASVIVFLRRRKLLQM